MASGRRNERRIHSRWDVTERRWLLRNNMPNGTRLSLERKGDGRKVRGDTVIHRKRLPIAADLEETVKTTLDDLRDCLITDIKARGQRIRLYAPDGSMVNGNTRISTVRAYEALPTPEEIEMQDDEDDEVNVAAETAGEYVETLDDACVSERVAPRSFVRALLQRHGFESVKAWVIAENKRL